MKTALVTGAGKGLGKACAIALAEAGAKVIIISRTLSDLNKVEKIIKKTRKLYIEKNFCGKIEKLFFVFFFYNYLYW